MKRRFTLPPHRILVGFGLLSLLLTVAACSTVKITSVTGEALRAPYQSLLVVSVFPSEEVRRETERTMGRTLETRGLQVILATERFGAEDLPTAEEITGLLEETTLAGVLLVSPERQRIAREAPDGGDGIRVGTWRIQNRCDPIDLDTRFMVYKENKLGGGIGRPLEATEFRVKLLDRVSGSAVWVARSGGLSSKKDLLRILLDEVIPTMAARMEKDGII